MIVKCVLKYPAQRCKCTAGAKPDAAGTEFINGSYI
jgi:hypothetical protein